MSEIKKVYGVIDQPILIGGKIFTSFIFLIGIGIVAIPTGLLASAIREVKLKKSKSK